MKLIMTSIGIIFSFIAFTSNAFPGDGSVGLGELLEKCGSLETYQRDYRTCSSHFTYPTLTAQYKTSQGETVTLKVRQAVLAGDVIMDYHVVSATLDCTNCSINAAMYDRILDGLTRVVRNGETFTLIQPNKRVKIKVEDLFNAYTATVLLVDIGRRILTDSLDDTSSEPAYYYVYNPSTAQVIGGIYVVDGIIKEEIKLTGNGTGVVSWQGSTSTETHERITSNWDGASFNGGGATCKVVRTGTTSENISITQIVCY